MDETQNYQVIISDRAKRMLGQHLRFLAKVSKEAAARQRASIMSALRSLSSMPQRYPFFSEPYIPPNKYHKMYVEKWYLVLYQIKEKNVEVDYILDCRQDYSWLFQE